MDGVDACTLIRRFSLNVGLLELEKDQFNEDP